MSSYDANVTRLRVPVPLAGVQGTLALEMLPQVDPPEGGPIAPVTDIGEVPARVRREFERQAWHQIQRTTEVICGDRPVTQLVRWTSKPVYDQINHRAQVVARAGAHEAGFGRGRRPVVTPKVQSIHTCFVTPAIAEVSLRIRYGARSRCIAARFELTNNSWVCTEMIFG
ncbi:Rv3235 family protein [Nocardioides speluncae]|uniref:Rv3235 family protein n=1 Tax=Nocardioides speluncae TaxID=2670337 RepID=UPI000D6995F5|nr:Rv3235 family protein [Nocardioides speluncae]